MPQQFTNNARATLASGISNVDTTIALAASKGALFPSANTGAAAVSSALDWFKAVLTDGTVSEIIYVRTRTGDSLSNVLRGQEGTTALTLSAGAVVGLRITSVDLAAFGQQADFGALKNVANTYTANQAVAANVLTSGAAIAVNASLSNNFRLDLAINATLSNPTLLTDGMVLNFRIKQDATGGRTLSYGNAYKFPGGTAPVLSTAANATDFMSCYFDSTAGTLLCGLNKGFA